MRVLVPEIERKEEHQRTMLKWSRVNKKNSQNQDLQEKDMPMADTRHTEGLFKQKKHFTLKYN